MSSCYPVEHNYSSNRNPNICKEYNATFGNVQFNFYLQAENLKEMQILSPNSMKIWKACLNLVFSVMDGLATRPGCALSLPNGNWKKILQFNGFNPVISEFISDYF